MAVHAAARRFDADDLAPFLDALPRTLNGQPLRHALEVRHPSFLCSAYVELARAHAVATVFTDSPDYPSLADLTGEFIYARLMRSRSAVATGYPADELHDLGRPRAAMARRRRSGRPAACGQAGANGRPRAMCSCISSAPARSATPPRRWRCSSCSIVPPSRSALPGGARPA